MKVLYIASTLARTGPTNQLYYTMKNLNREIFEPYILTLSPEPKDTLIDKFRGINVQIHSLNLSRLKGVLVGDTQVKNFVNKIHPDIIHTSGLRADEISISLTSMSKCISTLRNYPYEDYPMKFGNLKGTLMAKKHMKAISKMEHPIACSYSLKEIFEEKHGFNLKVVQNGVDVSRFNSITEKEKSELRTKLNLPPKVKIYISVGALITRKDPETVIQAFIKSSSEDEYLVLLGEGSLKEELSQKYSNDNIIFKGSVPNVDEYLKTADIFISASLSEGLPNTVLEALATGLPVILSDINQHKEILNLNSSAGLLAKPGKVESFVGAFKKISELDYEKMKNSAQEIIKDHLDASIMSSKYQELYQKLVSENEKL